MRPQNKVGPARKCSNLRTLSLHCPGRRYFGRAIWGKPSTVLGPVYPLPGRGKPTRELAKFGGEFEGSKIGNLPKIYPLFFAFRAPKPDPESVQFQGTFQGGLAHVLGCRKCVPGTRFEGPESAFRRGSGRGPERGLARVRQTARIREIL